MNKLIVLNIFRRSSLLPNCGGTPASGPRFDEHLLSPVTPCAGHISNVIQIQFQGGNCKHNTYLPVFHFCIGCAKVQKYQVEKCFRKTRYENTT